MRAALFLALLFIGSALQAQVAEKPKPMTAKPQQKEEPAKHERHERQKQKERGHDATRIGPATESGVKPSRTQPAEKQLRPDSAPSPAQQYQQQQYEQRQPAQTQRRQNEPVQNRVVQCTARPVCGGAGYGRCAAVTQSFPGATLQAGRREIVQRCIDANTPDSCNCAAQCTAVARCSIF